MCGVAAIVRRDGRPCDPGPLLAMRDALWHRGPDDAGVRLDGPVGLAHRRLSILDLSPAGHQPMCNEDGTLWLVLNGEIYNYIELRAELKARGHRFTSDSDTEVILHLYEERGTRCVESLNGMFAFALWDSKNRRFFAARDRLGIKPLYYSSGKDLFALASEVKGLLAHPEVRTALDPDGLADYFFAGAPLGSKTMFDGIRQLPPAHHLVLDEKGLRVERWWDVRFEYQHGRAVADVVADLDDLIDDAVRIHCRSDAPLGCHLSGGLDSSLVATLAARHRGAMDAFSVRFGDSAYYDELPHATAVADAAGARLHVVSPGADELARLLGTLTYHQDFPIPDTAGFSYYAVSRLAAAHVKVALTGHGGDEVFGGYPAQFALAFGTTEMFDLSARPTVAPRSWMARIGTLLRQEGLAGIARRVRSRHRADDSDASRWIQLHCGPTTDVHPLLDPRFARRVSGYSPRPEYLAPFDRGPTDEIFDRCLYHDLTSYLPTLLMKEDRASMSVSIESRVPLLDYRIIEYMATVPPAEKVVGRIPKALLRRVASRHVPPRVVERNDKTPFPVPLREWIGRELRPLAERVLGSEASLDRGIFAPHRLRGSNVDAGDLLTMLNVEIWFRVFIDQDPEWRPASTETARSAFADLPALPTR